MNDFEHVPQNVPRNVLRRRLRRQPNLVHRDGYWLYRRRTPKALDLDRPFIRLALGRIGEHRANYFAGRFNRIIDDLVFASGSTKMGNDGSNRRVAQMVEYLKKMSQDPPNEEIDATADFILNHLPHLDYLLDRDPPEPSEGEITAYKAVSETGAVIRDLASMRVPKRFQKAAGQQIEAIWHAVDCHEAATQTARLAFENSLSQIANGLAAPSAESAQPVLRPTNGERPQLFSEAAAEYLKDRQAKNRNMPSNTVMHPVNLWISLCGDRPMDTYTRRDLQNFVYKASDLPPGWTKSPELRALHAPEIIEQNRDGKWGYIALKTLREGLAGNIKALFGHYFGLRNGVSPFAGFRLQFPHKQRRPESHKITGYDVLAEAIKLGAKSNNSLDFWMVSLLCRTGRRIGMLAFLQPDSFSKLANGVWVARVKQQAMLKNGDKITLPFKTPESLGHFVIHPDLVGLGFIDWVKSRKTDFVFAEAHASADAADYTSKRVLRLLKQAASNCSKRLPEKPFERGTAHGFRSYWKNRMHAAQIDRSAVNLQIGHALDDVERAYRRLTDEECLQIAQIKDPNVSFDAIRDVMARQT